MGNGNVTNICDDSLHYNFDRANLGILTTQDVVLAETDLVTR